MISVYYPFNELYLFVQDLQQRSKIVRPNEKHSGHSVRPEKFEVKLNARPDKASVRS